MPCSGLTGDKRRILSSTKVLRRNAGWPEYEFDQLRRFTAIVLATEVVVTAGFAQIVDRDQGLIRLVVVMIAMLMVPVAALDRFGIAIVVAIPGRTLADTCSHADPVVPMAPQRHVDHDGNTCERYH